MKGFNMSLMKKLMAGGMCILIIPLMLVSYFSCKKASLFLETLSKNHSRTMAEQLSGYTEKLMSDELKLAEMIASETPVIRTALGQESPSEIGGMLRHFMKKYGKDYEDIYITDISGNIIAEGNGAQAIGTSCAETQSFTAVRHLQPCIGEVAKCGDGKSISVRILSPVVSGDGRFAGCVILLYKLDGLIAKFSTTTIGKTGYAFMIDRTGLIIAHPKAKYVLTLNLATLPDLKGIISKMTDGATGVDEYRFEGIDKIAGFAPVRLTGWSVGTTQPKNEFLAPVKTMESFTMIIALTSICITMLMVFVFSRNITASLSQGVSCAKKMAQGDFTHAIDTVRTDEIGTLAAALKDMASGLSRVIESVKISSSQVDVATSEVATGAQDLSQSTQEQAAAMEQIAATLQEMSVSIKDNAVNTEQGLLKAQSTLCALEKNMELGGNLSSAMDRIMDASNRIGQIITMVNEVALKTRLLSMNAAIEAARAGENGKSFAVVANEVRTLSQRTADASLEIKELICETDCRIGSGDALVKQSNTSLKECMALMRELKEDIDRIASSTRGQSGCVDELNHAVSQIDSTTQRNSAIAQELASAADNMRTEAKELFSMVEVFRLSQEGHSDPSTIHNRDTATGPQRERHGKNQSRRVFQTSLNDTADNMDEAA